MAESQTPSRNVIASRRRRAYITQRVIGGLYLAAAAACAIFAVYTWQAGKLNPINGLVFALAIVGTAPIGILALRGDYLGSRGMDEGQRAMSLSAESDAFRIAYLGLYVLFFGLLFFPTLRDVMAVAIGILLLLITAIWVGGYMYRRWRL